MKKEDLIALKEKIAKLSDEDKKQRDLYLRGLASGDIEGPMTGYASIDKPWLKYYDFSSIETDMPKMTCYDYVYECNKDYLDNIALSYFGKKISFKEFFENVEATAKALKEAGVKEDDIITISLPNIPEAAYLFYACSKIGAIANMVDPRTSDNGIKKYIEEVDSKLVIIVDSYFYKINNLIEDGIIENAIVVSPAESLPSGLSVAYKLKSYIEKVKDSTKKINYSDNVSSWAQFIEKGKKYHGSTKADYKKNKPFIIEHTGGTTGAPKGVVLSNENINAVALQSVLTGIDMQREHTWLDIMPTFIAYGVGMGLHLPLTIGMETILIPQFDAKKFDELILKHKPVHMVGVPSYWGTIINSKKMKNQDLSFMIAPTVGGDAMDKNLEVAANNYLKKHNCSSKITKGYGMTEVTGGVVGTLDASNKIGSVGSPFVKCTVSIFDSETKQEMQYGQLGEVCITGPNTMLGYFDNPEATNDVLKTHEDGNIWVHSGDIGYITENGDLFIVDRLKRMIIRYDGFKVFPSIIENILSSHDAVEICKVIGIKDLEHSQGKLPKAHIVLKDEYKGQESLVIEELKKICAEKLPEYAQPCDYQLRSEMPLTSVGKIDYRTLEQEEEKKVKMLKR